MSFACVVCGRVSATRYCAEHGASNKRPNSTQRGYGSRFQRVRTQLLATNPKCAKCPAPATTAHHNPPRKQLVALGIEPDLIENLEPLCTSCHALETNRGR